MPKATNIGRQIRELRMARGMTQKELAEAIDLTIESLSRAERGAITPTVQTLGRMARALGTSLDALAEGSAVREPPQPTKHEAPELARLHRQLARMDRRTLRRLLAIVELLPAATPGRTAK